MTSFVATDLITEIYAKNQGQIFHTTGLLLQFMNADQKCLVCMTNRIYRSIAYPRALQWT